MARCFMYYLQIGSSGAQTNKQIYAATAVWEILLWLSERSLEIFVEEIKEKNAHIYRSFAVVGLVAST